LAEGRRDQMRELFSGLREVPQEQRAEKMREIMEKARRDVEADMGKILLPHQMKRATQLMTQMQMRGGRGMLDDSIAQDLGLTDAQKEQLRAKSAQLEEEVRKKLAELRAETQNELLKVLTPAQQAKWKDMVGEPFEFQREEMARPTGDRPQPQGTAPAAERPRRGGGR
jgi:Spy/CpxP family protein refolding chaperone